ncbi:MAG: tetratricopeptide repeat protein [Gemmataceae bacterium]|nr:tetratricopeptide repeat protein [Gemmataceae bacterium]
MTTTPHLGSKVGRARRSLSQLWQVPMFLIGLLALIGVAASSPWRLTPQQREFDELIAQLRNGLDRHEDADALVGYAQDAMSRLPRFRARSAEVHFLVGSAYYRQAREKPPTFAKEVWPRATEHLEQALAQAKPDADRLALQYRLGYSLYQQDKDVPRALELMTLSVEKGAEQPLQGYRLLVEAHLQQKTPNLEAALSAGRRVLDLTPERETEAIAKGRLQIGELLLRQGLRADAVKELDRITAKAPRAIRLKARMLQAQASEDDSQWTKAIAIWQGLLTEAPHVEEKRARIYYALGWCHQQKSPPDTQETLRIWAESLKLGGPAGQAAGLRLGQLRLTGLGGAGQALADWSAALASVQSAEEFSNPYIKVEQVREWLDQAIRHVDVAQDAEKTQAVAELYRKITAGSDADFRIAQAAEAVAKQRAEQQKAGSVTAEEVQAQFRRAGAAYEQAAKARPEPERSEPLWRSAQCFLAARDSTQARQILLQFVGIEPDETRLAEGWYTLGDLYRHAGDKKTARDAYHKCIEIPSTPFANRARLHLAIEERELKNYVKASEILEQVLSKAREVDLATQEKAQYQMTLVLMLMEDYDKAHVELKEFVHRFPENANCLLAREQLGECCRHLARRELVKEIDLRKSIGLNSSEEVKQTVEDQLNRLRRSRKELLDEAVKTCEGLADELQAMAKKKPLSNIEQIVLRRARFGLGECYFYGVQYFEALEVFRGLQANNRRTVEGLYACVYVYDLAGMLQSPPKRGEQMREFAKESVRMLLEDLKAMPADDEVFKIPGMYPREWWLHWAKTDDRKLLGPPRVENAFP